MGGDSCSKGREFESQHRILDGHFLLIYVTLNGRSMEFKLWTAEWKVQTNPQSYACPKNSIALGNALNMTNPPMQSALQQWPI